MAQMDLSIIPSSYVSTPAIFTCTSGRAVAELNSKRQGCAVQPDSDEIMKKKNVSCPRKLLVFM